MSAKLRRIVHRQILLTRLRDWWDRGRGRTTVDADVSAAIADAHSYGISSGLLP